MSRIRSVHPDICTSETMADLEARYERTFVRLWTHCDDEGRCLDNVRLIKAALYPLHDKVTFEALEQDLAKLTEVGLIVRYEHDGSRLIQVVSWDEFQHPQRARASKYAPPDLHVADTSDDDCDTPRGDVRDVYVPGVGEGEGEGEGGGALAPLAASQNGNGHHDPLWEAMLDACSIEGEIGDTARKRYNTALSRLKKLTGDPNEIYRRATAYRLRFPGAALTPMALESHWAECKPDRVLEQSAKPNGNVAGNLHNLQIARTLR